MKRPTNIYVIIGGISQKHPLLREAFSDIGFGTFSGGISGHSIDLIASILEYYRQASSL